MGKWALILGATLIAGCASKSEDISASYFPANVYQNYDCNQLQQEAVNVSQQAAVAAGQQDKIHHDDTVKTTVGVVLLWPVLLFNKGDGPTAANLANLRGQMNAIEQASIQKQCNIQFHKV